MDRGQAPMLDMSETMRAVREALVQRPWEARAARARAQAATRAAVERQKNLGLPLGRPDPASIHRTRPRFVVIQGGKD